MSRPIKTSRRGRKWPAVNPKDGRKLEISFSQHRLEWIHGQGLGAMEEMARVVTWVLAYPKKIYEGILRDEDEDRSSDSEGWLCYSASPKATYHWKSGQQIERPGRVLLVFVNSDLVAYTWRWEPEDAENPGTPADRENRFRREAL